MKFPIFLFASLFLLTIPRVEAATWQDLSTDESYILRQNVLLHRTDGVEIPLDTGESFKLVDILPLDGISVVDFVFSREACEDPALESEMEIILPEENAPESKSEVGVQQSKDCKVEVFVELKDLFQESLFRAP